MQGMKRLILFVVAVSVLALPVQGFAQESSGSAYSQSDLPSGDAGDPVGTAADTTAETSGGSLPFTGLDVVLIAVAGTGILALGLGMRRLTRSPESA